MKILLRALPLRFIYFDIRDITALLIAANSATPTVNLFCNLTSVMNWATTWKQSLCLQTCNFGVGHSPAIKNNTFSSSIHFTLSRTLWFAFSISSQWVFFKTRFCTASWCFLIGWDLWQLILDLVCHTYMKQCVLLCLSSYQMCIWLCGVWPNTCTLVLHYVFIKICIRLI